MREGCQEDADRNRRCVRAAEGLLGLQGMDWECPLGNAKGVEGGNEVRGV